MYLDYYGFKEKPFNITPNPRFVFLSKNHKEAFAHLLYGIDNHAGFIVLTGEVGTGKTTVLRTLLGQLDKSTVRSALILNPPPSVQELLGGINREYGIAWEGLSGTELLDTLNQFLLTENRAGHTVVLVIDEAQNLDPQVLEQIRLISNLETETDKLIQIILAGQPELAQTLRRPELRQLEQRITVRYHLSAMDFDDTKAYIEHRLEVAGGWRAATFSKGALKKVFAGSGGLPRLINIICDRALLIGYTEESREIFGRMAARAIGEVREKKRGAISRFAWWVGAAALLVTVVGMYAIPRGTPEKSPLPRPAQVSRVNAPIPVRKTAVDAPLVIRSELAATTEGASAASAFNALFKLWGIPSLPAPVDVINTRNLDRVAEEHGLTLVRLSWSLDRVLKADSPALLEINFPGLTGKRYLALIGRDKDRLFFAPPLKGCDSISSVDLRKLWSGRAYLPWRNYHNIPRLGPGMRGDGVTHLQQLLAGAGVYHEEPSGIFDRDTFAAIKAFQSKEGITQSGKAGKQTLFFLYHRNSGFSAPRLEIKGREQKG